jgi:putative acetyltransferase
VTELVVRTMQSEDLSAVADLWWRSLDESLDWLRPEQKHGMEESKAFLRSQVVPRCKMWVAERAGRLVGMLALDRDEVDRLYVAPEAQGQGVGSALLDHAKALCPGGLRLVTLMENQPARRFYERRGFEAYDHGRSPQPEDEPDVWYRWPAADRSAAST